MCFVSCFLARAGGRSTSPKLGDWSTLSPLKRGRGILLPLLSLFLYTASILSRAEFLSVRTLLSVAWRQKDKCSRMKANHRRERERARGEYAARIAGCIAPLCSRRSGFFLAFHCRCRRAFRAPLKWPFPCHSSRLLQQTLSGALTEEKKRVLDCRICAKHYRSKKAHSGSEVSLGECCPAWGR